ncbi:hypothetical protein [Nitrosovibrio sp. Nv6]|uniref:hypothetical protein n=1 Tax=Nitrosovibrio sp. Nv6 TaxID=1855340 RepID=UPI0008B88291|nr:hypothetical protein [Nitrosovibrio sp. Nv6]SEP39710.1 hypothetical protein SAMN05216316_2830 [Nitrosovibrio sp. Nv6]
MKIMKLMCATALMLLGSIPAAPALAGGGHGHHGHHGHHHGHHHHRGGYGGYGLALGLGLLGYGLGSYSSRAPYYPPSYGYPPVGYAPNYGYGPGYGYAPVVAAPSAPPVYIQQREVVQIQPQAQAANYWHYCRSPEGYYPYVKKCPDGWLRVAPQPGE